ncbi:hypothetical protein EW146_g1827 [Bondarzewia mesenterica]|uniref:ABC transporter domain-containing protein n=1 Tax=Bondarzewia mesenterica TaxID=1095465 RepID=A0A4S4M2G3_9AGAM|nr:hypothetical protein EW146_g1827 [Bondarzewia mesenterica]
MTTPLLTVKNVSCARPEGDHIFANVDFDVNEGDIVVLRARSGVGELAFSTTLVDLEAYLTWLGSNSGPPRLMPTLMLTDQHRAGAGVPAYRTHVQYVPQRPSLLPSTPREFLSTISTFQSRHGTSSVDLHRAIDIASSWGVEEEMWDRAWNTLSGGEAQRIALAIGFGLGSAILLLDEPTSALDATTSDKVERTLIEEVKSPESPLKAIVWITHSEEQATRVGTRFLHLLPTGVREEVLSTQV